MGDVSTSRYTVDRDYVEVNTMVTTTGPDAPYTEDSLGELVDVVSELHHDHVSGVIGVVDIYTIDSLSADEVDATGRYAVGDVSTSRYTVEATFLLFSYL